MRSLKSVFSNDEVFAHPTEGVWGLGCNPFSSKAVENLFELKKRPKNKAVIVLAGNKNHLQPFIENLTQSEKTDLYEKWPGPHTWLIPALDSIPKWLKGDTGMVALRLSSHPDVINITNELNSPICSTSANLSGKETARNKAEIRKIFGPDLYIADGELGKLNKPSSVQELITGKWIRK